MATKLRFETADCARCGGTGHMPFAAYGGVCFKCNGVGQQLTPAGRSARNLYDQLVSAACATKQAWEVEVGETVTYATDRANRWFTVVKKDFSSRSGAVVDARCLGSAELHAKSTVHLVTPDTEMKLRPTAEAMRAIVAEVTRRRKGATLVTETAAA